VPNLIDLKNVLSQERKTAAGTTIDPVFYFRSNILPQCSLFWEEDILATVRTISFASGSKF
jgi:hypothetical protein